jgi:hypothetical protein
MDIDHFLEMEKRAFIRQVLWDKKGETTKMGYSTDFKGELKFTNDPTVKQLGKLQEFLGQDCREHPEWGATHMTYIDLELLDDFLFLVALWVCFGGYCG